MEPNHSSVRCENCGCRVKYRDHTGLREWCKRCIDVWQRCQELTEVTAERRIQSQVDPGYLDAEFDDLDDELREKLLELERDRDLFLFGPVGTGKTHAMAALIRKYVYEGYECERINFDDFCIQVRSTISPVARETEWDLIEPLKKVDKLFIDDLGLRSKQETDFAYVTLYSLLNKRQERMLPTFICSNKNIGRLAQAFDARIASRLGTALKIEMTGEDRRKKSR